MDPFLGMNTEEDMNWLFNLQFSPSMNEITSEILTSVDINTDAAVAGPSTRDTASGPGITPFEDVEQYGPFDETILFQDEHAGSSNNEDSLLETGKKRKRNDTDEDDDEESPAKRRRCSTPSPTSNLPASSSPPWEDEDFFINLIMPGEEEQK